MHQVPHVHVILKTALENLYDAHDMCEEMERRWLVQGHTGSKCWSWDWNPSLCNTVCLQGGRGSSQGPCCKVKSRHSKVGRVLEQRRPCAQHLLMVETQVRELAQAG